MMGKGLGELSDSHSSKYHWEKKGGSECFINGNDHYRVTGYVSDRDGSVVPGLIPSLSAMRNRADINREPGCQGTGSKTNLPLYRVPSCSDYLIITVIIVIVPHSQLGGRLFILSDTCVCHTLI